MIKSVLSKAGRLDILAVRKKDQRTIKERSKTGEGKIKEKKRQTPGHALVHNSPNNGSVGVDNSNGRVFGAAIANARLSGCDIGIQLHPVHNGVRTRDAVVPRLPKPERSVVDGKGCLRCELEDSRTFVRHSALAQS